MLPSLRYPEIWVLREQGIDAIGTSPLANIVGWPPSRGVPMFFWPALVGKPALHYCVCFFGFPALVTVPQFPIPPCVCVTFAAQVAM